MKQCILCLALVLVTLAAGADTRVKVGLDGRGDTTDYAATALGVQAMFDLLGTEEHRYYDVSAEGEMMRQFEKSDYIAPQYRDLILPLPDTPVNVTMRGYDGIDTSGNSYFEIYVDPPGGDEGYYYCVGNPDDYEAWRQMIYDLVQQAIDDGHFDPENFIPEPATVTLMGMGLAALALRCRPRAGRR